MEKRGELKKSCKNGGGRLPKQMGRNFRRSWIHFFFFLISNQYFCKKTTTIKRKTNYIKEVWYNKNFPIKCLQIFSSVSYRKICKNQNLKTGGHHAIFSILVVKELKTITTLEQKWLFLFTFLFLFFTKFLMQKLIYKINIWFNFVFGSFFE